MKIGIDAKWFFSGPESGKVVVTNLVENLIKINKKNQLYIFLDKKYRHAGFPFKNENVKIVYIWRGINLFSNLFVIPYHAKTLGIEVVLFQYFISISSKFENISFIHDIKFLTNPEYYTIRERLYLFPLKYLIPKSRLIFTVSEEEKKRIVKYFNLNNDLVKVIYHGVNNIFKPLEQFPEDLIYKVKKKNNLPENYLLYVGRLNIRKNLLNLIKAVHSLENKDIPLVMAGKKDWKFHEVKKLIDRLNLNTRIKFLGFKEGEELACIYALSTIFCFPSLVESFGLPAAEAMAAGIPAVVSNTTSLPEICSDAGSYADPNRPEDIASVVDELLRNKNLYNEKKRLGIERAKLFKWETAAEKILYHIENIGKNSN